jgi:hypothetical protein
LVFVLRGACVQLTHNPLISRESEWVHFYLPAHRRALFRRRPLSAMAAPGSARCHRRPPAPARHRRLPHPRRYRPPRRCRRALGAVAAPPDRRAPALPARPRPRYRPRRCADCRPARPPLAVAAGGQPIRAVVVYGAGMTGMRRRLANPGRARYRSFSPRCYFDPFQLRSRLLLRFHLYLADAVTFSPISHCCRILENRRADGPTSWQR